MVNSYEITAINVCNKFNVNESGKPTHNPKFELHMGQFVAIAEPFSITYVNSKLTKAESLSF